jgi:hypothetical protein
MSEECRARVNLSNINPEDLTPEQQEAVQEAFINLGTNINTMAENFFAALTPVMLSLQQVMQNVSITLEDAFRDNAYHPQGPVLDSTAQVIDNEQKALPAPREDEQ